MTEAAGDIVVVSYNLHSLRDSRTASAVLTRALGADLALVQETPRFLRWRSRLAGWSRRAGLFYAAGGRTAGGAAVLAGLRLDLEATAEIPLTRQHGLHQRALAATLVRYGRYRLLAVSTHLSLNDEERAAHLVEIAAHLDGLRDRLGPDGVVLGVDVNEPAGGPTWQSLAEAGLRDSCELTGETAGGNHAVEPEQRALIGSTFPASAPSRRIDGVFVAGQIEVDEAGVPAQLPGRPAYAAASDHLPVIARLRLG